MPDTARDLAAQPPTAPGRADEILDRCKLAFARKGFDGTSMQDLARAAGMSASNFYRYFASKDAIIIALVEREMAEIEARFAALSGAERLRPLLLQTLAAYLGRRKDEADGALWAEMQAAANRHPEVGEALRRMEETVTGYVLRLFARMADLSDAEVARRYRPHAEMIFLLSRGALMTRCSGQAPLDPTESDRLIGLVMRAVDQLLDDVSATR